MNDKMVIPGQRIGCIYINDSYADVEQKLHLYPIESKIEERATHRVIHASPYRIWFDRHTGKVTQISVGKGYEGTFLDRIGVGSTLRDIEAVAGRYREDMDVYVLEDYPGICFELEDVDDWQEESAPIEFISVFPISRRSK